jgi:sulfatase maturation enzyme AslB (radical SAM superfamily)
MVTFPKIIQFETNILCNADCPFCPQKEAKRKFKIMPDEIWRKVIDQSRGKGVIYRPFMVNEPLTDKRLPEIIRYIKKDNSAKAELNSNGALLTGELGIKLIEAGLDIIRFSVDGFSKETYKQSGRGDNYDVVVKNIVKFVELKKSVNGNVVVYVRMIEMDINKNEKDDFLSFWGGIADKAVIVPLYRWPWTGQEKPVMKPCPKIKEEMFFNSDGQAVLCCWDNFGKGIIGDGHNDTVEEIWNGEINQNYRRLLNEGKRDEIILCSKCDGFDKYDFSNWKGY